jgi:UV DNA damage endonuclease
MIGVCCQWLSPRQKRDGSTVYENEIEEKILQLGAFKSGKYSEQRIRETYHNNVDQHLRILPNLINNKIKLFRLTSTMLPLYEFCGEIAKNDELLKKKFATLGSYFTKYGIRVTCHPGQFTVISSDDDKVVENAIKELEYHAWMFDMMGLPNTAYSAINIHGGKSDRSEKIVDVVKSLPDNVKNRLTFENDESSYNVRELLDISSKTGIPVVFDSHHHVFNTGSMSIEESVVETMKTWGDIKPLQHLSNTEKGLENGSFTERRKHSDYIHYIPQKQLDMMIEDKIDVDIEAKAKNLAVLKLRQDFSISC